MDSYDPAELDPDDFLGYRPDPRPGIARRGFHVEYERDGDREIGRTLVFVLFGPDRLVDATVGTPWTVDAVYPRDGYYRATIEK